ncbi:hypothetical protein [Flavobacterium sp.]|uniref:hypothetical protein n=1 Tax=Flavobacterium sp. TaxID=239 RepID=UPI0037532D47
MSYYKEQLPELIANLKIAITQCSAIISQEIDSTLNDDKLHAVLKAKRMATDDVKFYAKEIDVLEAELTGKVLDEQKADKNLVKKFSKQ